MVIQLEASTAQNSSLKEEEMELDLELSVGGSFRNLETSKPKIDSKLELCSCSRSEDAKAKREIQALRRQEAKKKREKKKGMRNGGGVGDERMRLEAQRLQSTVKDRERRENNEANLTHHKSYINHRNHGIVEGPIQMMVPIKYAYPSKVQYVPLAFPCVVPCGAPATWLQPVKSLPVRQGCGGRSVLSDGWTNSSASVSHQDSGSSDIGSLSSHTRTAPPQRSEAQGQSEHSVSSYQKDSSQGTSSDKSTSFGEKVSTPVKDPTTRRNSSTGESPPSPLKKARDGNGDLGEPPKPRNQNHHPSAPSLEQMPCVSTTGNGPNGKTITGFLYRYTKAEISIVCVCHGSSFSPAGFVEHAGGIDVSHPLRHITVIPSAFA